VNTKHIKLNSTETTAEIQHSVESDKVTDTRVIESAYCPNPNPIYNTPYLLDELRPTMTKDI